MSKPLDIPTPEGIIPPKQKDILKSPDLMSKYVVEVHKKVVGEDDTIATILLVTLGGKLTRNASPTSTNLMVNDDSGAGKDYIVRAVLGLIPEADIESRKRISEKAFTYWHNAKMEPEWTWDGKVCYLEDCSNSVLNSDVFKVMSSSDGDNKSTIVVNNITWEILTRGKPVLIITIAVANPKQELLRRFPICNLNITKEQTRAILERKAIMHAKGIMPSYNEDTLKSIIYLQAVKVKVPFADKIVDVLSCENIIIRTHYDRFIDYVKFSAALHQYQRERDEEGYLIATGEDYEVARTAIVKTTSNVFSIPLTRTEKQVWETLKNLGPNITKGELGEKESGYTVSELEPHISFCGERQIRKILTKFVKDKFVKFAIEKREADKPMKVYSLNEDDFSISIPSWDEIQNSSNSSNSSVSTNGSNSSNSGVLGD